MVVRKRIRSHSCFVSGSGGGGTTPGGTVSWGPNFGGTDGDQLSESSSIDISLVELTGNLSEQSSVSSAEADITYTALQANDSIAINQIDLTGNLNVTSSVASLVYDARQIPASKDSFVPTATTLGSCNDNTNKNGQDLRVANLLLAENNPKIYTAWNLTSFPNNATVTSAFLILKPNSTGILAHTYHVRGIDSSGETWTEAGIICSNAPAVTAPDISYNQPADTNEITIDISAAASYIAGRMGSSNTCTFVIEDQEVVGQLTVYESNDQGVDDASGPRLILIFSVPV